MSKVKIAADQRKKEILSIAINLAKKSNDYTKITRSDIARNGKFSVSTITRYFTIARLHSEILANAIRDEIVEIIAQGLARRDKQVLKLPGRLKTKVIAYLTR